MKRENHSPHKTWRRIVGLSLLVVLLASVFAGCSGSNTTNPDSTGQQGQSSGNQSGSGKTSGKDTLVIATNLEPTSFFPLDKDFGADKSKDGPAYMQIYDTLTYVDTDGNVKLSLATDYTVSDDGLEYIFTLRDDVYFHNGKKMTAEDVAFGYNLCIEKNPAVAASQLQGLGEAVAIDDTHVKCILKFPSPAFLNMLSTQAGVVICKSYYEEVGSAAAYNDAPIGTGAYKFVSRVSGEGVTFEANENYWGGAPAIKHLKLAVITSVSTQFISLESGDVDVIVNADLASCHRLGNNNPVATWSYTDSAVRTSLWFDFSSDIRDDINLRRAIQSGINKQEIVDGVLYGYGKVLDIDVVTGFPSSPEPGMYKVIPYDVEKAKEYLAASDYDGRPIKILVPTGSIQEKAAQIIQGQLQEVGVQIEVVPADTATLQGSLYNGTHHGNIGANTNVWFDFCNPGMVYNPDLTRYTEDQIFPKYQYSKDLYAQIARELNPQARKQLMADLMNFANEEAYSVPLFAGVVAVAYNRNLNGLDDVSPVGSLYVKNLSWK